MTNSFGAYVKKARKEKPKINHHDLPLPSQLEQEASIQQELSAQLSSLSTHSMRPVRKTEKFNKRVTDRLHFESSLKPSTNAKQQEDRRTKGAPALRAEDVRRERRRMEGTTGGNRPRTPVVVSASPSAANLASGASVLLAEGSEIEPSTSQVFPFMNEGDAGKTGKVPKVARPKFSSVPVAFVDDGRRVKGDGGQGGLTDRERSKLAATMIDKVKSSSHVDEAAGAGDNASAAASVAPSEKAPSEAGSAAAALTDVSNVASAAPSVVASDGVAVPSNKRVDDETTSELKAAIQKLSKQQVARWKDIIRNDTLTPASFEESRRIANFNRTVAMLRERIYAKSSSSISAHFQALDLERRGALDKDAFRKALDAFNLGDCLNGQTAEMLMDSSEEFRSGEGLVNYAKFTEALRMGRIKYIHQPGRRLRIGPDPEKPFGTSAIKRSLPYGIMEDGVKNTKIYDSYLRSLYQHVEGQFLRYDKQGKKEIEMGESRSVLKQISTEKGLKLSDNEIEIVSDEVNKTKDGKVMYLDFLKGFKGNSGEDTFTLPEFLKPKTLRRSQSGHPWSWTVEDKGGE